MTSILPLFHKPAQPQAPIPMATIPTAPVAQAPTSQGTASNAAGQSAGGQGQASSNPVVNTTAEMYWCIDKIFADPSETVLCFIPEVGALKDDYELYTQVNRAIRRSSGRFLTGWFLNFMSWKRCTKVEFVKVSSAPFPFSRFETRPKLISSVRT